MRLFAVVVALFVGLSASIAMAHNPLQKASWCSAGAEPMVVSEFAWTGEAIARADSGTCRSKAGAGADNAEECDKIPPNHGQFDDDWVDVTNRAQTHCDQYEEAYANPASPDWGSVVVIAVGPRSYLDDAKHHQLYELDHGLTAACVRCQPMLAPAPVQPVAPLRR